MAPIESFFIKGLQSYPDDGLGRRASASVFFVCLVECFRQRKNDQGLVAALHTKILCQWIGSVGFPKSSLHLIILVCYFFRLRVISAKSMRACFSRD